jgi:hypothetical protein
MHPVVAERSGWRGRRSRVMMVASTCGAFVQKGGIRRVYRVRERGQGQRGGSGYLGYAEIGDSLRRGLQAPASNPAVARRLTRGEAKGEGGGDAGVFIGVARRRKRPGIYGN